MLFLGVLLSGSSYLVHVWNIVTSWSVGFGVVATMSFLDTPLNSQTLTCVLFAISYVSQVVWKQFVIFKSNFNTSNWSLTYLSSSSRREITRKSKKKWDFNESECNPYLFIHNDPHLFKFSLWIQQLTSSHIDSLCSFIISISSCHAHLHHSSCPPNPCPTINTPTKGPCCPDVPFNKLLSDEKSETKTSAQSDQ